MNNDVIVFIKGCGQTIVTGLTSIKIPGTDWSILGLFTGILLCGFAIKLLHSLFSALSVSGGISAGSNVAKSARGLSGRSEVHANKVKKAKKP